MGDESARARERCREPFRQITTRDRELTDELVIAKRERELREWRRRFDHGAKGSVMLEWMKQAGHARPRSTFRASPTRE